MTMANLLNEIWGITIDDYKVSFLEDCTWKCNCGKMPCVHMQKALVEIDRNIILQAMNMRTSRIGLQSQQLKDEAEQRERGAERLRQKEMLETERKTREFLRAQSSPRWRWNADEYGFDDPSPEAAREREPRKETKPSYVVNPKRPIRLED